ncbi:hypothetical protein [Castellaniella sp.]|uniref:hypothetical protein n=1 Tax=Castellaniella sp. TaxID=1955812 RepID=UPI002AFF1362|nr:hypothetical protein [Castellaniella sp.]
MEARKKWMVIGAGAVVVVAVGWVGLSAYASSRAEDKLYALLDQYHLRGSVQWQDLSASPFGSVSLKGVQISPPQIKDVRFDIQQLDIDDLESSSDESRATLKFSKISSTGGHSPLGGLSMIQAAGRTELPAMSLQLAWDFQREADTGSLHVQLGQPEAFQLGIDLELARIADLMRAVHAFADDSSDGRSSPGRGMGGMRGAGGMPGLSDLARLGSPLMLLGLVGPQLGDVALHRASLDFQDQGYVKRTIAILQRSRFRVVPGKGDAAKQREVQFKQFADDTLKDCQQQGDDLKSVVQGGIDCDDVLGFLTGDEDRLRLTLEPQRPVPILDLIQAGMRNPEQAARMLNIKVN